MDRTELGVGITLHIISSNLSYQFGRTIRTTQVDFND